MANHVCGDNRFEIIERYKKELTSATNIEGSPDEMAVLDNILFRFWQMGWLKEQEAVRWIPVTEKLPKSMANKVIVYLQHDELVPEIGYGHYEKYKGVEMWYNLETNEQFSYRGYTVTHWMPMPKSPEGEKLVLY